REHLLDRDAKFWEGDAQKLLPNETFDHEHEMRIGNKTLRLVHAGRGHTDGDLVVLFVEDRVLMTGDLVWNHCYPNIDLEAGASVAEGGGPLDRIGHLDYDRVIPGHGPVMSRDGVREFQGFIRQLWQLADAAAQAHTSLTAFQRDAPLTTDAGFEKIAIPF